jgi:hypothetical protein
VTPRRPSIGKFEIRSSKLETTPAKKSRARHRTSPSDWRTRVQGVSGVWQDPTLELHGAAAWRTGTTGAISCNRGAQSPHYRRADGAARLQGGRPLHRAIHVAESQPQICKHPKGSPELEPGVERQQNSGYGNQTKKKPLPRGGGHTDVVFVGRVFRHPLPGIGLSFGWMVPGVPPCFTPGFTPPRLRRWVLDHKKSKSHRDGRAHWL